VVGVSVTASCNDELRVVQYEADTHQQVQVQRPLQPHTRTRTRTHDNATDGALQRGLSVCLRPVGRGAGVRWVRTHPQISKMYNKK